VLAGKQRELSHVQWLSTSPPAVLLTSEITEDSVLVSFQEYCMRLCVCCMYVRVCVWRFSLHDFYLHICVVGVVLVVYHYLY